jgi:hypothetical protein
VSHALRTGSPVGAGRGAAALAIRLMSGAVGLACAVAAAWLAAHHPLSPALALAGCSVLAGLTLRWPVSCPLWLLPLLPLAGLMPFTGWIVVEELDLLVLAVAAGGWLRRGFGAPGIPTGHSPERLWTTLLWLLPLGISTVLSMQHGIADAGGLVWGWWQGYREPLNSVRLAKPLAEVLLLLPLWQAAARSGEPAASRRLESGMVGLLTVVASSVMWERLAYTGLLDFSSDYRVTGPFWEMHVGGAALDAVLAMGLPFAFAGLFRAAGPWRWAGMAAVLAVALYAALVTFSRIVYVAAPLGLLVLLLLQGVARRGRGVQQATDAGLSWGPALLAVLAFTAAAAALFPSAGYRGLLALWGAVTALLTLQGVWRGLPRPRRWQGLALAVPVVALVLAVTQAVPKGAYVAYALATAAALGLAMLACRRPGGGSGAASIGAFAGMLAGTVAVSVHWGGPQALGVSTALALGLGALALGGCLSQRPPWPDRWRWQAQTAGLLLASAAVVGVFGGGAYMGKRLSDASQEAGARRAHWQGALDLMGAGDRWLGMGLGRFASVHALSGRPVDRVGDYRLLPRGDREGVGAALVMSSGGHPLGFGEVLRVAQRVATPAPGPVKLRLGLRSEGASQLVFEICERHLLYPGSCVSASREVAAQPGWQTLELRLAGDSLGGGPWYAPRLSVFALALESRNSRIVVDRLSLVDGAGRELLVNGEFGNGLSHWFFTSDRWHLPWHAKNAALHLLIEQGLFGLGAFGLLTAAALWRLGIGAARRHPLAPPLAAAIVGSCVVGLIDSLFDMPRVTFLVLTLLTTALLLPRVNDPPVGLAAS